MPLGTVGASGPDIADGVYLLGLAGPLEDAEPGQYGARIKWRWWIYSPDGQTCYNPPSDDDGDDHDPTWWQFTSTRMGEKAEARKWSEALLGRELVKGETGEQIGAELFNEATGEGRWMTAMIMRNEAGYLGIVKGSAKPYGTPAAAVVAAAAPAPAPAPVAAPAGPGKPLPFE